MPVSIAIARVDLLRKSLEAHEGVRTTPYTDTLGNCSIGIGHNLTSKGITPAIIDILYYRDIYDSLLLLGTNLPWVADLDDVRKRAFVELAFNMGGRLLTFHNALKAAQAHDWTLAAEEFLDSTWARQVGSRAIVLASMLRTGQDPHI